MIVAGAGSGKTRVLTYRIAHLLKTGVDAFNILSLTFTNKAAREMKERIEKIVGSSEARNLWMGTFHSVFAKILRIEAERLGYPSNFTIYDTDDTKSLIKTILKEQGLDDKIYKPGVVYNRISSAKNSLISWQAYKQNAEIMEEDRMAAKPKLGLVYELYQKRCFNSGAMDFDDLLFNTNVLLRDFPEVLNKYQHKFKYILVDEYQDTNFSQYVIVKKLAAASENICVVGDDAQSIYAFRGANIQNILNFKKDYPDLQVFKLEQNYRSTQVIVNASNSVIRNNKDQLQKDVWTSNDVGDKIKVVKTYSDNEEGNAVAHLIFETKMNEQAHNHDFAILYRTNAQSRAMEEALRKMGIPYRIYGGLSFYKRKEIKDLLAYYRLTINHNDEEALKRIINYPARGIGNSTLEKLVVAAAENNTSIWNVIESPNGLQLNLSAATYTKLQDFVMMIRSFEVQLTTQNAFTLGNQIAISSGLLRELYTDKSPEGVARHENIQELLNGMKEFSDRELAAELLTDQKPDVSLTAFMQDIALLTDSDESDKDDTNKVSLMTIHSAKGLEFPYVHIVGLEENLFPSQLSLSSRDDLEEERRLFYVALTRAEKKVTLSYSTSRYKWGNLISCEPSRFIEEVDSKYLDYNEPASQQVSTNFDDERSHYNGGFVKNKFVPRQKEIVAKPAAAPLVPPRKNLVRMNTSLAKNNSVTEIIGDDTKNLQPEMMVEHGRFGKGVVKKMEGVFPNQKATIHFESAGEKLLILKFAKLKII
ncbi:MAG: UvrD-helicase domain-containing protein [Bacteroidetes bacterium]|nr:UvrD-helicase domain-containing protein [Bacteroidota bacterium]